MEWFRICDQPNSYVGSTVFFHVFPKGPTRALSGWYVSQELCSSRVDWQRIFFQKRSPPSAPLCYEQLLDAVKVEWLQYLGFQMWGMGVVWELGVK